jgi:two-component system cell cycle response regulator DivK
MKVPLLVVDDNPANLKLARVLLTQAGYEVHTASDAAETHSLLRTLRPHLILMDVKLPGTDGLELTRQIKSDPATKDIVVLAISADAMPGGPQKAREAGCEDYLTKPIDTRTFPGIIAKHLPKQPGR